MLSPSPSHTTTGCSPRQTLCHPAFTLVELLVVISIIALLIAMLLPSLAASRQAAKNAVCLSNQRQLAIAGYSYATDDRGNVLRDDSDVNIAHSPWRSYWVAPDNNRYVRDVPRAWGRAYARGQISAARTFYCPESFGRGTDNSFEFYWSSVSGGPPDWRTHTSPTKNRARAGYMFNPFMIVNLATPDRPDRLLLNRPGISALNINPLPPPKRILVMDVMHTGTTQFHPQPTWNITHIDGSGRTYRDARKKGTGPGDNWVDFDAFLNDVLGM
jgi:prepilin-type N-terminal cleavage/methylation domain-containing protein